MYEYDIDLTPQRRSYRVKSTVYSLVLGKCLWEEFDRICPRGETRKTWILEWNEDFLDKGVNRQALIMFRIHQLSLENLEDQDRDSGVTSPPDRYTQKETDLLVQNRKPAQWEHYVFFAKSLRWELCS